MGAGKMGLKTDRPNGSIIEEWNIKASGMMENAMSKTNLGTSPIMESGGMGT